MTAEGEPKIIKTTKPDETSSELMRVALVTNPDAICLIDPQIAGKLLAEHLEHVTLNQFKTKQ